MIPLDQLVSNILEHKRRINEIGCWIYTGSVDQKGYGQYRISKGRCFKVHRLFASHYLGLDIDSKKLRALHKPICPNKNCFNPDHLYVGTDRNNIDDAIASGIMTEKSYNGHKTHCPKGHEYSKENTMHDWSGRRLCRECNRLRCAEYQSRKRQTKTTT